MNNKNYSRNEMNDIIQNPQLDNYSTTLTYNKNSIDDKLSSNKSIKQLERKDSIDSKSELSQSFVSNKGNISKKSSSKFSNHRNSVLFAISPDILKLQQMKNKYGNILTETHQEIKSKNKKKNSKDNLHTTFSPEIKRNKTALFNKQKKESKIKLDTSFSSNFNTNTYSDNNKDNKQNDNKSNNNSPYSKKDKLTPLPMLQKKMNIEKKDFDKILHNSVMLRRIEFSLKLKQKKVPKIYNKQIILIQNTWKKYFNTFIYVKILKIQSYYRKYLAKKILQKLRYKRKQERNIKVNKMVRSFVKICWIKNFTYFKKYFRLKSKPIPEIKIILSKEIGTQIGDSFEIKKEEEKKEEEKKEDNKKSFYYPSICLKTFPRPFIEIGINFKTLLNRYSNKRNNDIDYVLQESLTYQGNTGKLISFLPNKKIKNPLRHLYGKSVIYKKHKTRNENNFSLNLDKKISNTFFKSKNLSIGEYDILKDKIFMKKIHKKVINKKWSYKSKNNITFYIKKIIFLQTIIRKYLKETKIRKQNKIQKFLHLKLFVVILMNNIKKIVKENILSFLMYIYLSTINSTFDNEIIVNDNERMSTTNENFLEIRQSLRNPNYIHKMSSNFNNFIKNNKIKFNILESISSIIYNDETIYQNVNNILDY